MKKTFSTEETKTIKIRQEIKTEKVKSPNKNQVKRLFDALSLIHLKFITGFIGKLRVVQWEVNLAQVWQIFFVIFLKPKLLIEKLKMETLKNIFVM